MHCYPFKKQSPRYDLIEFSQFQEEEVIDNDAVDAIAKRFFKKHQASFEELAK
ncbi:MAG: hypothetical protein ABGU93_09770 [Acetobacterium sp.]|uniref:hypothetical protein n=1 Tax=Acetobacterium sp. TaxID=1872094 RepID=UPI0032421007